MRRKFGYFGTMIPFGESHDSSHQLKKGDISQLIEILEGLTKISLSK